MSVRAWVAFCCVVSVSVAACAADEYATSPRQETDRAMPESPTGARSPNADDPPGGAESPSDTEAAQRSGDGGAADPDASGPARGGHSHFECKSQGTNKYRPYWLQAIDAGDGATVYKDYGTTPKGLLGQNPMTSQQECDQARAAANNAFGVICSRTGLDGWKPTLYTGTVPGRADFGYLGGSSITKFADCLKATENSSSKGVCYWGGSAWYVSAIDREGSKAGPFPTIDACVANTRLP